MDNLNQVIESSLNDFAKHFAEVNRTVEHAVKKTSRENCTWKRRGNKPQLGHALQALKKFDKVNKALKAKLYEEVMNKTAIESGESFGHLQRG